MAHEDALQQGIRQGRGLDRAMAKLACLERDASGVVRVPDGSGYRKQKGSTTGLHYCYRQDLEGQTQNCDKMPMQSFEKIQMHSRCSMERSWTSTKPMELEFYW